MVEALVQDSPVLVINICAPNKTYEAAESYEILESISLQCGYDEEYKLIIGDDFNVPLNLNLDSNGSKTKKKDAVKKNQ